MAVMKVIEVLAQSDESWEDAARLAFEEASRSIRNIKSLYVENMQAVLKDGGIVYRLDAKITFAVDSGRQERHSERAKAQEEMPQADNGIRRSGGPPLRRAKPVRA